MLSFFAHFISQTGGLKYCFVYFAVFFMSFFLSLYSNVCFFCNKKIPAVVYGQRRNLPFRGTTLFLRQKTHSTHICAVFFNAAPIRFSCNGKSRPYYLYFVQKPCFALTMIPVETRRQVQKLSVGSSRESSEVSKAAASHQTAALFETFIETTFSPVVAFLFLGLL